MSATMQVVRVPSGGTITVRTGVLRGAGPQGPMGPQGPPGQTGPQGIQGEKGEINALLTKLSSTAQVAVGSDRWYPATMDVRDDDELLVAGEDGLNLQFQSAITCLAVVTAIFETTHAPSDGGTAAGARQLRLVDAAGNLAGPSSQVSVEAVHNRPTIVHLIAVVEPDPSRFYHLEAKVLDDIGVSLTSRWVTFVQIGAGPAGPAGPQGPVGQTGPQGPQGTPGSAGSGYTSFNLMVNGNPDTTLAPVAPDYNFSADQGLRTPKGTQPPHVPYFMAQLAVDLEPLLVARYATAADRSTKRSSREAGEMTYLDDSGSLNFREKNGNDNNVARVIVSTNTPPSAAGSAAPGVLWVQT